MMARSSTRESGMWRSLAGAWTRFRHRRIAVAELRAMDDSELGRLVQDAGVTFADLLALARQSGQAAALLYRRLEKAGIEVKSIDSVVQRDLQRCCSFCASKGRCQYDLDGPQGAGWKDLGWEDSDWKDYYPNRETIEALALASRH
jgi:uncharacterized protein YjiS (DUF1127 family)